MCTYEMLIAGGKVFVFSREINKIVFNLNPLKLFQSSLISYFADVYRIQNADEGRKLFSPILPHKNNYTINMPSGL